MESNFDPLNPINPIKNSELEPPKSWLGSHKVWGYVFLTLILVLAVYGIYQWKYKDGQIPFDGTYETTDGLIGPTARWQTYISDELGVSFIYPPDLKVYQQDEDNILIKAEYKNPQLPLAEVTMLIRRADGPNLATKESIDEVLEVLGQRTVDLGTRKNYRILKVEGRSQYYFLSDGGNLLIDDDMDAYYKDQFIKEGIYQKYRGRFDTIRDSITIDLAKLAGISDIEDNLKKSRDSKRIADIRTIQTALELHFNDDGFYPASSNGQPIGEDPAFINKYLLFGWPTAPTPPDGSCTVSQNNYYYTQLNNGSDYSLTYCLGDIAKGMGDFIYEEGGAGPFLSGTLGDLSAGPHTASPRGIE